MKVSVRDLIDHPRSVLLGFLICSTFFLLLLLVWQYSEPKCYVSIAQEGYVSVLEPTDCHIDAEEVLESVEKFRRSLEATEGE